MQATFERGKLEVTLFPECIGSTEEPCSVFIVSSRSSDRGKSF
jgi:hypothetical protein